MIVIRKNERLKELRYQHKMPQIVLALETGIHVATISRIECGYLKPTSKQAQAIAAVLGVDPDWLFDEGEKNGA